jgi:hypothetical protein
MQTAIRIVAVGGPLAFAAVGLYLALNPPSEKKLPRKVGWLIAAIGVIIFFANLQEMSSQDAAQKELGNALTILSGQNKELTKSMGKLDTQNQELESLTQSLRTQNSELSAQISELSRQVIKNSPVVGRVAHFQFNERQIVSSNESLPNALQITILTDEVIEKPAFVLTCDGPIAEGRFFIPGQLIYTMTEQLITDNKRSFGFRFASPSFTPESPIIVTLFSKSEIRCSDLTDARLIQFQIRN